MRHKVQWTKLLTKIFKKIYLKFFPFFAGVVDTADKHSFANISANFRKNLKWSYWDTQGPGGHWFMKKTWSRKSRVRLPLNCFGTALKSNEPNLEHKQKEIYSINTINYAFYEILTTGPKLPLHLAENEQFVYSSRSLFCWRKKCDIFWPAAAWNSPLICLLLFTYMRIFCPISERCIVRPLFLRGRPHAPEAVFIKDPHLTMELDRFVLFHIQ